MTFNGNLTRRSRADLARSLFIALATTIDQFDLPQQPFDDLLDAFRQDQHKTRYASFDELFDYCRRSANPVGRIVLRLGDCFDEENAALSDQICTGLQLANFWQDVARDYAIGRIYLPADEMSRFGVTESMFEPVIDADRSCGNCWPASAIVRRAFFAAGCRWPIVCPAGFRATSSYSLTADWQPSKRSAESILTCCECARS